MVPAYGYLRRQALQKHCSSEIQKVADVISVLTLTPGLKLYAIEASWKRKIRGFSKVGPS